MPWPGEANAQPVDARVAAVRAALDKGKVHRAVRTAERYVGKPDAPPQLRVLRAEALNRLGEHRRAWRDIQALGSAMNDDPAALSELGAAWLGLAKPDSAAQALESALALGHEDGTAYRLAMAYMALDRTPEAIDIFDAMVQRGDAAARVYRERGSAKAGLADTTGMLADLDRAIDMAPRDPVNWNSRGYHGHARHGRHREAIADYDRAIKLDPNYAFAFNNRGWSRSRIGDVRGALKDIRLSGRKRPGNPYVFRNMGIIALEAGDTTSACMNFRKALGLGFTAMHGMEVEDLVKEHCAAPVPKAPRNAPPAQAPAVRTPRENAP